MKFYKVQIGRRWLEIAASENLSFFHSPGTPIESAYWGKTPGSPKDYKLASIQDFLGAEALGEILVDGEYADDEDDREYALELISKTGEIWSLLRSNHHYDDIFPIECALLESLDLRFKTMIRKDQIIDFEKRSQKFFWIMDQDEEFPLFAFFDDDSKAYALYEVVFKA
jgi:hypothetical protein